MQLWLSSPLRILYLPEHYDDDDDEDDGDDDDDNDDEIAHAAVFTFKGMSPFRSIMMMMTMKMMMMSMMKRLQLWLSSPLRI